MYVFVSVFTRQENSISLVKAYWNELFTLGLAQCWQVMNVATILATFVNCLHSSLQQGKNTPLFIKFSWIYKELWPKLDMVMIVLLFYLHLVNTLLIQSIFKLERHH
jgi:hypothetical protein